MTHSREPLRENELPLKIPLLGNVFADPEGAYRSAIGIAQARQRQDDIPDLAVLRTEMGLVVDDIVRMLQSAYRNLPLSRIGEEHLYPSADDLFSRVA